MSNQRISLIEVFCHIPYGFVLTIETEGIEFNGRAFLSAAVYQHAPGWQPGDLFDEDDPSHGWPSPRHPEDRFLDRLLFSIGADCQENFEHLLARAILSRWPNPQPGLRDWIAGLERRPRPTECPHRMPREAGAGHWREWHRGHGCDKDPDLTERKS